MNRDATGLKDKSVTAHEVNNNNAFRDNERVTGVVIPSQVICISDCAFFGCSNLSIIEIPDSVTEIGMSAFDGTLWLAEKRKDDPLVIVNHILIDGRTASGAVVIPDDVVKIADSAFY